MEDKDLQQLVEHISETFFQRPFQHQAYFNGRLRTTGGRYLLSSHNIELNPHLLAVHGMDALVPTIKHELCHYHLHLMKKGYRHGDDDFMELLEKVGGSRYCKDTGLGTKSSRRYVYVCTQCGCEFPRKRSVDTVKYRCGRCRGKLQLTRVFRENGTGFFK